MKYLIALALILMGGSSFAQVNIIKAKTKTIYQATSTSTKFSGSMGEVGISSKVNGLTLISYCLNSGNEAAVKENNKKDTTTFRASILRGDGNITITHPDGTQSIIIDNGNYLTVKATGGLITTINKLSSTNPADNAGQYFISYNKNMSEVKTIYGTTFKFEKKGNVATITNWDGSYFVMITTGKASVIVDSKGKEILVVNDDDKTSVMNDDGTHFIVVTEDGKQQIIHDDGKKDIINEYGGLGLLSSENGELTTMFNYNKIGTDKDTGGGELTKLTVDKTTLANASK
ncbi:hypothetical protein FO440_20865 [Mucilaginibacter corticis]|uniref:Uncharacterized protein n=1 Tax=Mucilaginibacter corticis TaxID=2597670 RepID=A0A556MBB2_9SPHI|nr:hypothetical protein [Mucilaginibacter corticis]TSJ37219.1 hypothetical protein FO440_20865 [Mucilaginibacter corticis]